jgi:nitroreductase
MKQQSKSVLYAIPGVHAGLRKGKQSWQAFRLRVECYLYDYQRDRRHLSWRRNAGDYWQLSSELIFQYHKLEKGLCLPPESRRFFGADAARETRRLLGEWLDSGNDPNAPVVRAALETLRAWRARAQETPPRTGEHDALIDAVDQLLNSMPTATELATPIAARRVNGTTFATLNDLLHSRRSTRDFDGTPVDFTLVEQAIAAAQLSPSACNRQPWHIHFYDKPEAIRAMLALQNGNSGFGQTVPLLAVVTADMGSFFDASERTEPALDGGLFLMSFLLSLQSLGLSSCCLNWCVLPERDRRAHELGHIPPGEKILTFLAIGNARPGAVVPLSARRPTADVIRLHEGLALPGHA